MVECTKFGVDKRHVVDAIELLLSNDGIATDFADSQKLVIEHLKFIVVEGVGNVSLPVSIEDWAKLRNASHTSHKSFESATRKNVWRIDASQMFWNVSGNCLMRTLRKVASGPLRQLGSDFLIDNIEFRPSELILCEAGESLKENDSSKEDPNSFATMILQIPVQGGFHGGTYKIHHRQKMKYFDCSVDSSRCFYSCLFYADCGYQSETLLLGRRLILVYRLTVMRNVPIAVPMPKFFQTATSRVEKALIRWDSCDPFRNRPHVLAIPLEHRYTEENLTFGHLMGRDRYTAALFRSISFLDVHLALLSPNSNDWTDGNLYTIHQIYRRFIKIKNLSVYGKSNQWMAISGWDVDFQTLSHEMQFNERKGVHSDNHLETECKWLPSVLIIWPWKHAIPILCRFDYYEALVRLKTMLKTESSSNEEQTAALCYIADYCRRHFNVLGDEPEVVMKGFPELFMALNARAECLQLLKMFAEWEAPHQGANVAWAIHEVILFAHWDLTVELFHQLPPFSTRWAKIGFCAALANGLVRRKMLPQFLALAQLTLNLFLTSEPSIFFVQCPAAEHVAELGAMVFRLEEETKTAIDPVFRSTFTDHLRSFDAYVLGALMDAVFVDRVRVCLPSCRSLYREICLEFLKRDLRTLGTHFDVVIWALKALVAFDEADLLQRLVDQIASVSSCDSIRSLLFSILSQRDLIDDLMLTIDGRRALNVLKNCLPSSRKQSIKTLS